MSTRLAVIGAGWAGLAAALAAVRAGHAVSVFEAARQPGGRARTLALQLPDGRTVQVDNGQHILVGAYGRTLATMRSVGVDPTQVLLRMPLTLRFPDGGGIALPPWRAPLDAAAGILRARGWSLRDKLALLRAASRWQSAGFDCAPASAVSDLCAGLTPKVVSELIEPLCVSALNTPAPRASGQVFLRVVRDTLFAPRGSNLLLPRRELGSVFPLQAAHWLQAQGASVHLGRRVQRLERTAAGWLVDDAPFERVLLACPAAEAARLAGGTGHGDWAALASALRHEAIATVYASGPHRLPLPLLALRSNAREPAQFVFDRSQLGGPAGLLAFVVSACGEDVDRVQQLVMAQAHRLGWTGLQPLRTVIERRATFACTPGLLRPPTFIAPGLTACGDYVAGPYPATIEGAVRSALEAAAQLT